MNILQIYGQVQWHDEAMIVGDEASLIALRTAIDAALQSGHSHATVFVSDGEGYDVLVVREDDIAVLEKLVTPYLDEIACDHRSDAVWPEVMFKARFASND